MILYFYSSMMTHVVSRRAIGENLYTRRSRNSQRKRNFSQNSCLKNSLKISFLTHMTTPLHPSSFFFSLDIVYTHALLVLHCSQLTHTHFLTRGSRLRIACFPLDILLILSTAGYELHPLCSSFMPLVHRWSMQYITNYLRFV